MGRDFFAETLTVIVKKHQLFNKMLTFLLTFTFLFAISFFYVHIFLISPTRYQISIKNLVLWFVALPLNLFYTVYGKRYCVVFPPATIVKFFLLTKLFRTFWCACFCYFCQSDCEHKAKRII